MENIIKECVEKHSKMSKKLKEKLENASYFNCTGGGDPRLPDYNSFKLKKGISDLKGDYVFRITPNNNFSIFSKNEGILRKGSFCGEYSSDWKEVEELSKRSDGSYFDVKIKL